MDLSFIIGRKIVCLTRIVSISIFAFLAVFAPKTLHADEAKFQESLAKISSTDLKTKYAALINLPKNLDPQTQAALQSAILNEKDVRFRLAVLDRLAAGGNSSIVPSIAPLLQDKNHFIRRRAAQVLGIVAGPTAAQALQKALSREADSETKATLLQGLSLCGSAADVSAIQAALADSKPEVRAQAILALDRIPGSEAKAALEHHRENDPNLKKRVQEALDRKAKKDK